MFVHFPLILRRKCRNLIFYMLSTGCRLLRERGGAAKSVAAWEGQRERWVWIVRVDSNGSIEVMAHEDKQPHGEKRPKVRQLPMG